MHVHLVSQKKCHKIVGNEASSNIIIHKNNTNHNTHKINQCNTL